MIEELGLSGSGERGTTKVYQTYGVIAYLRALRSLTLFSAARYIYILYMALMPSNLSPKQDGDLKGAKVGKV